MFRASAILLLSVTLVLAGFRGMVVGVAYLPVSGGTASVVYTVTDTLVLNAVFEMRSGDGVWLNDSNVVVRNVLQSAPDRTFKLENR